MDNAEDSSAPNRKRPCPATTESIPVASSRTKLRGSANYQRRRAVTACLICRQRKIKCSNDRPKCVSCTKSNAPCLYDETQSDLSTFDPASLIIIQKLNEVLLRLPDAQPVSSPQSWNTGEQRAVPSLGTTNGATVGSVGSEHDEPCCVSNFSAVERLLEWPIFGEFAASHQLTDAIFMPSSSRIGSVDLVSECHLPHQPLPGASGSQQVPSSQHIAPLVERYLLFVHPKHPFIDVTHLRASAAAVAEFGPAWDPPTCLVLLASAVGATSACLSTTDNPSCGLPASNSAAVENGSSSTGEDYYEAARRRFGSLGANVLSAQCHALAGLYMMNRLRPVQAWQSFTAASVSYLLHRRRREAESRQLGVALKDMEYTPCEQRVFWTCSLLEGQLAAELQMPGSGIGEATCTRPFPPPEPQPDPDDVQMQDETQPTLDKSTTIWLFHFTNISLWRLVKRINDDLYASDADSWTLRSPEQLLEAVYGFEKQLSGCIDQLPESLRFTERDRSSIAWNTHHNTLRRRYMHIQSLLYRPFLYLRIHHWDVLHADARVPVLGMAQKGITSCVLTNDEMESHDSDDDSWYHCRLAATQILTIVAARKAGLLTAVHLREMNLSDSAVLRSIEARKAVIDSCIHESADLQALKLLVERLAS